MPTATLSYWRGREGSSVPAAPPTPVAFTLGPVAVSFTAVAPVVSGLGIPVNITLGPLAIPVTAVAPVVDTGSGLLVDLDGYWPLDESSGTRSDVVGTSHLTDINTVTSTAGKVGTAAVFVAADSEYLSVAHNAAVALGSGDMTIAAWAYLPSKTAAVQIIVGKYGTNGEYALYYDGASDRFRAFISVDGGGTTPWVTASTFGAPATSTWYFLLMDFTRATMTVRIAVNGGALDSHTGSGTPRTGETNAFAIGASGDSTFHLTGRVDEVGLWHRILTATERTNLFGGGAGVTWPFVGVP
jgi:hypothetical protein